MARRKPHCKRPLAVSEQEIRIAAARLVIRAARIRYGILPQLRRRGAALGAAAAGDLSRKLFRSAAAVLEPTLTRLLITPFLPAVAYAGSRGGRHGRKRTGGQHYRITGPGRAREQWKGVSDDRRTSRD